MSRGDLNLGRHRPPTTPFAVAQSEQRACFPDVARVHQLVVGVGVMVAPVALHRSMMELTLRRAAEHHLEGEVHAQERKRATRGPSFCLQRRVDSSTMLSSGAYSDPCDFPDESQTFDLASL